MTQYNSLNVKLSNLQLNKLKSGLKNATEVTLNFSSNLVSETNGKTNLPNKLLSANRQVSRVRKASSNNLSTNIVLSKTQLSKMAQLGDFLLLKTIKTTRFIEEIFKNKNRVKTFQNFC